ncbi:HEPN domain-containing protein [Salinicola salarius]|uniref:HEPN domain-containing protein n=1 Tax=Salinicola salarius TaxID=430457 RepID=UPI0023E4607E|nr:HEPN domain-containing protein [Salinicola salarius]MDF3918393.1 HEPN domain-containing protein [Salinicola salarius]
MQYATLKQRHRQERDSQPVNLSLRLHRALSWLNRAEQVEDDDGHFIFLWIAFNAAYATEIDERYRLSEQATFREFLKKLCDLDTSQCLSNLVWQTFPGAIRVLLDNPYVFQSFWDFHSGKIDEAEWQKRFTEGKRHAHQALASGNTPELLGVVFNRIYTLRNQLIHGGATWNGAVNRDQLRDCVKLMSQLVPLVITVMMDNPHALWGDACYPVVEW